MTMDKWYEKPACNIGTVICGQVCVIRNAAGYPFAHRMNAQQKQELVQAAARAIAQSDKLSALQMEFYDLRDYTDTMKERMISRLIIPPFMIEEGSPVQVFVTPDESISIILGGSEHICIQVSTPGKTVLEAYNTANMIDDELNRTIPYAWNSKYGYLTENPVYTGTGLSVSYMLHMPYMERKQKTAKYTRELGQLGFLLNEHFKGKTFAPGDIFRIRNRKTLGLSEGEILSALEQLTAMIASREENERNRQLEEQELSETNRICRGYGILKYARCLGYNEAMTCLSGARTGDNAGLWNSDVPVGAFAAMLHMDDCEFQNDQKTYTKQEIAAARSRYVRKNLPEIELQI